MSYREGVEFVFGTGRTSIAQQLVQSGADINAITNEGCTPLHRAASQGYADIVRLFISAAGSTASQLVSDDMIFLPYPTRLQPNLLEITGTKTQKENAQQFLDRIVALPLDLKVTS